jgi:hypothetical protein
MSANCSIIPQIQHKGKTIDSKLFKDLWDYAKTQTDDATTARSLAKAIYYTINSPAFKSIHNNDLQLDEYGEPTIDSLIGKIWKSTFEGALPSSEYNDDTASEWGAYLNNNQIEAQHATAIGLSNRTGAENPSGWDEIPDEDRAFMNRVMSHQIISHLKGFTEVREDNATIKQLVLDRLDAIQRIVGNQYDGLARAQQIGHIINIIKPSDSWEWRRFIGYFKKKFGLRIPDVTTEEDPDTTAPPVEINRLFDENANLRVDLVRTVSGEIKYELAKSVYSDPNLVSDGGELIPNHPSSKYGIPDVPEIEDIWQEIIALNAQNHSKQSVIQALELLSASKFNHRLDAFIDKLRPDGTDGANRINNFYNLFYRTANLAITDNINITVDTATVVGEQSRPTWDLKTNNRNSRPVNVAYNDVLDRLRAKTSGKDYNTDLILAAVRKYDEVSTIKDSFDSVMNLAKEIGIPFEPIYVLYYIRNKSNGASTITNYNDIASLDGDTAVDTEANAFVKQLSNIQEKLKEVADAILSLSGKSIDGKKKKSAKYLPFSDAGFRGTLHHIAEIISADYADKTDMSYYNSASEREYSPQYNSFITDLFDGLVNSAGDVMPDEDIIARFEDYTKDSALDFDNLLWSHNADPTMGLFFYKEENGRNVITGVNRDFISRFNLIQISGMSPKSLHGGVLYRDIKDDNWTINNVILALKGYQVIPTADSSRNYAITSKFREYDKGLSVSSFEKDNEGYYTGKLNREALLDDPALDGSDLYLRINNILNQEFSDVARTFDKIYDTDEYLKTGKLKLKPIYDEHSKEYDPNAINKLSYGIETGIEKILDKDGNTIGEKPILIKKGKPAGRVFNLSNLSYVADGKSVTLASHLASTPEQFDYLAEVLKLHRGIDNALSHTAALKEFVVDWLIANHDATTEALALAKDDIVNAMETARDSKGGSRWVMPRVDVNISSKRFLANSEPHINASFNRIVLNLFLNDVINSVSLGNLLYGSVFEYKGMVDFNKRASEIIKNGASTPSTQTYRMMVMSDVLIKDVMPALFDNKHNGNASDIAEAKRLYSGIINTSDAIDIITDEELIRRFKEFGIYDRYADLIKTLQDPDAKFNPRDYTYMIEQLKYFSYTRKYHNGRIVSYQNKNSTIVLFPRFIKGTDKEHLYNFMKKNNINDINAISGAKVGDIAPFTLHNPDGTFDVSKLEVPSNVVDNHVVELTYKDLRVQLETTPHLVDEDGTIATQLIKKIMDGIRNNTIDDNGKEIPVTYEITTGYTAEGKPITKSFKGRTDNHEDSKRGVFEDLQDTMSYNAQEAAIELLRDFGALVDGKVQEDSDGNIRVDFTKVAKVIEDEFLDSSDDLNILKATRVNKDGTTSIPYHHPTLLRLIEARLEAKITNKVTRQKLPQIHVPIAPDLFNRVRQDTETPDTHITYTKEYLEQMKEPDGHKLRAEYYDDNGVFHPAQILINPYDSNFNKPEFLMDDGSGRPDINKIKAQDPKALLMFGTRIPHEGDQSSFVAEVVGFLHTGASQTVTPDHLIARTGWDFDIDTVYLYRYSLDSKLRAANMYDNSEEAMFKRLQHYVSIYHADAATKSLAPINARISELQSQINELNDKYAKMIDKIKDKDLARRLNNIGYNKAASTADKLAKIAAKKITVTSEENDRLIREFQDAMRRGFEAEIKYLQGELILKPYKELREATKEHAQAKAPLIKEIVSLKADKRAYIEDNEAYRDEFNKLNIIKQATRAERDNNIIDHFIAIHSNTANLADKEKPNEMGHMKTASDYVNELVGLTTANANQNNFADKLYFRNLNMNVAMLKEHSVAYDNILAIMNVLGGRTAGSPVEAVIKASQIKGYDGNLVNLRQLLLDNFGKVKEGKDLLDNFTIQATDSKGKLLDDPIIRIKNIGFIGNNILGNGKDIQGENISKQRSELTANVLDAVKQLMINLNSETFSIFAFLASTPLSYYTDIHMKGAPAEVNRFIYPSLFVSQPVIQDLSREITANSKFGDRAYGLTMVRRVKETYLADLLNSETIEGGKFAPIIHEYLTDTIARGYQPIASDWAKYRGMGSEGIAAIRGEEMKSTVAELARFIKTGNFSTADIDRFIDDLNYYLSHTGYDIIENKPFLLEELDSAIKDGKELAELREADKELKKIDPDAISMIPAGYIATYNIKQLSTLLHYEAVSKASNNITSLMGVLNTDRKGAGPTSSVSNDLFTKIVKIETNYDGFLNKLKHVIGNNAEYKAETDAIDEALNSAIGIPEKISVIYDYADKWEISDKTLTSAVSDSTGRSIISAVFGDALIHDFPDYTTSRYPYLAAQLYWTNVLSSKLYGNVMLTEDKAIKKTLNRLLYKLGTNDEQTRYRTIMYILGNRIATDLNFFNLTPDERRDLLGIVEPKITVEETSYTSPTSGETQTFTNNVITYEFPKFKGSADFLNPNIPEADKVAMFRKLSIANQVALLKEVDAKGRTIGKETRFLINRIDTNMNEESLRQNGYIKLTVLDQDTDINASRDDFKRMYNSDNIYDRIVAENLIRYTFIQTGLQFGSNISKYIPIDLMSRSTQTRHTADRSLESHDLYRLASAIHNKSALNVNPDSTFVEQLHKSMWNFPTINPVMEPTFSVTKDGGKKVNRAYPTFAADMTKDLKPEEITSNLLRHIIVESKYHIDRSKYSSRDYLIKNTVINGVTYPTLYKRYDKGDFVFYYPVNRTLPYEYGTTVVSNYTKVAVGDVLEDIADPSKYIGLIDGSAVMGDTTTNPVGPATPGSNVDSTSDEGYSATIDKLANESDVVVHIGTTDTHEGKMAKATGKAIILSEADFISKGVDFNSITSTINLAKAKALASLKPTIPQNLVSGVRSATGHMQVANSSITDSLGEDVTSIDMIDAGVRTRTTRSTSQFNKYNINVGDFVWMVGKDRNGNTKKVLTQITDIYGKKDVRFRNHWSREGWTEEGFGSLRSDLNKAIEFKIIRSNSDIITTTNTKQHPSVTTTGDVSYAELKKKALAVEMYDVRGLAMQYFVSGGKMSTDAMQKFYGNKGGKHIEGERKSKFGWTAKDGKSIDQIAHSIWESLPETSSLETSDIRDGVEDVINSFATLEDIAKFIVSRYVNNESSLLDTNSETLVTPRVITITGDTQLKNAGAVQNKIASIAGQGNVAKINTIVKDAGHIGSIISGTLVAGVTINSIRLERAQHAEPIGVDTATETRQDTPYNTIIVGNSPEEAFASIMARIRDGEKGILATAARFLNILNKTTKDENLSELEKVVVESKELYESLNAASDINAMLDVLGTNLKIYDHVKKRIDELMAEIRGTDTTQFVVNNDTFGASVEYRNKLMNVYNYLRVVTHLASMPIIDNEEIATLNDKDTDTTKNDKTVIELYNNIAMDLQNKRDALNSEYSEVFKKITEIQALDIIKHSHNPKYMESLYNHALEYIISEGYDPSVVKDIQITPAEIQSVIARMLNDNEDINMWAAKLDSALDSGITLSDIMGKVYAESLFRAHAKAATYVATANKIFDKAGIDKGSKYSSARAEAFKSKYLDDMGNFISKYEMDSFLERLTNYNALKKSLEDQIHSAHRRGDTALKENLNKDYRVVVEKLNSLRTESRIPSDSAEYEIYSTFYHNAQTEKDIKKYAKDNGIKFKWKREHGNRVLAVIKYIPSDEFLSKKYAALNDKERQFIDELQLFYKTIISDTLTDKYVKDNFIPFSYSPNLSTQAKQFLGITHKQMDDVYTDLNNERQYYITSHMLKPPRVAGTIRIPKKLDIETDNAYTSRVLTKANVGRDIPFKNIEEIKAHNKKVKNDTLRKNLPYRNLDPVALTHMFIDEMSRIKTVKDFESTYKLTLITMASDQFKVADVNWAGKSMLDRVMSGITGKREVVYKQGKDSNIFRRLSDSFAKALYNTSRIQTDLDVALNAVLRSTSLVTMGFNYRSGIKNAVAGYVNIVTEAWGGEYFNKKELVQGSEDYRKSMMHIIRDAGKYETDDFTTGIIKYFGNLFEDVRDKGVNVSDTVLTKGLHALDNVAYISMNSGEHFLQFATLLTMLRSHRLVHGQIMTESDFLADRRLKALEKILTEDQMNSLRKAIYNTDKDIISASRSIDTIKSWIVGEGLSSDVKKAIDKALKEELATAKEQFTSFPVLRDMFELDKEIGRIRIKEGSGFDETKAAMFMRRVRGVNHSLQGIYNQIDRNALQDTITGEVIMQFRKWMRPTFIRWFGARYGKTSYSEILGNYRSGAYIDTRRFLTSPITEGIRRAKENSANQNVVVGAMLNIAKGYIDFIGNVSFYYHMLPKHEQANVMRTLAQMIGIAMLSTALYAIYHGLGSDDDKDKYNNFLISNTIYQLAAIQTELTDTTMIGWGFFYKRTKQNVVPIERTLTDLASFFYYAFAYPFMNESDRYYERGIYKGETKVSVKFNKVVPGIRQIQNASHMSNVISFYQMYNPLYNVFGVNKTGDRSSEEIGFKQD